MPCLRGETLSPTSVGVCAESVVAHNHKAAATVATVEIRIVRIMALTRADDQRPSARRGNITTLHTYGQHIRRFFVR